MKKRIAIIVFIILIAQLKFQTAAEVNGYPLIKGEASAYCYGTVCAYGDTPTAGITCAMSPKYKGYTVVVYHRDLDGRIGEYIGTYEVQDTGSYPTIQSGKCVDIWMDTKEECKQFGRPDVYIQLIPDAAG